MQDWNYATNVLSSFEVKNMEENKFKEVMHVHIVTMAFYVFV